MLNGAVNLFTASFQTNLVQTEPRSSCVRCSLCVHIEFPDPLPTVFALYLTIFHNECVRINRKRFLCWSPFNTRLSGGGHFYPGVAKRESETPQMWPSPQGSCTGAPFFRQGPEASPTETQSDGDAPVSKLLRAVCPFWVSAGLGYSASPRWARSPSGTGWWGCLWEGGKAGDVDAPSCHLTSDGPPGACRQPCPDLGSALAGGTSWPGIAYAKQSWNGCASGHGS